MDDPSSRQEEPTAGRGAPRWAKVFGAAALVIVVALVLLLLVGSGHGPGRHTTSGVSEQARR